MCVNNYVRHPTGHAHRPQLPTRCDKRLPLALIAPPDFSSSSGQAVEVGWHYLYVVAKKKALNGSYLLVGGKYKLCTIRRALLISTQ